MVHGSTTSLLKNPDTGRARLVQIYAGLACHDLPLVICLFARQRIRCRASELFRLAGDSSVRATPVPIPNTVVKPDSANGTPVARPRESRPSPAPLCIKPVAFVQ